VSRPVEIARTLLRRPAPRAGIAALAVLGLASGSLPLLDAPGYELGEVAALLATLLAPFVGIAAVRDERTRPRPSPLAAFGGAALVLVALLGTFLAAALVRAAIGPCSAFGPAAGFLPLLALPSALVGAGLAVAPPVLTGAHRALAAALYALAAAASLAWSLRVAYTGPAAFLFDPLLGAWPGPLYDEAIAPDLRVVLFRAAAAAEGVAIALFAEVWARARRSGAGAALAPALALLLAAGAALGARATLSRLALSGDRAALERALGGRRDGPRCTLLHAGEKPAAAVDALLAECEFHHADVARALGVDSPPRVVAWVYRSAEEKRRLVGAARTEYAKPWLGEIHLVDAPAPHPVLRHEVVHAVAAAVAGGPLGVPARAGVLVSAGLVEGLAVALETPRSRWTTHEWSRAARDEGFLPDVRGIVGPAGFWTQAPARAYTAAGSFLAFVLERHGAERLREAYRTGDLAAATGVPLDVLAAEWQRFLDGVEVPPGLADVARARLSRPSVFARPCAREIATIEQRAGAAARAGRTGEACALYREVAARSGSPGGLKAAADVLARAGDLAAADEAYRDAKSAAADHDALRSAIAAAQGDLAWRRGATDEAAAAWTAILAERPERADARLLHAKLVASADAELSGPVRDYLLALGDPAVALARVARLEHPLAAYLVGRALAVRGESAAAIPELARAAEGALPAELSREAAFLLGEARCAAGERARGEAALRALLGDGVSAADRARVEEALRRCAFEAARGSTRTGHAPGTERAPPPRTNGATPRSP
jgi:hypothetical protein